MGLSKQDGLKQKNQIQTNQMLKLLLSLSLRNAEKSAAFKFVTEKYSDAKNTLLRTPINFQVKSSQFNDLFDKDGWCQKCRSLVDGWKIHVDSSGAGTGSCRSNC